MTNSAVSFIDEEIMVKVKKGDLDKLSILFQKYKLLLYNFFVKHTLDKEISNDLVQKLFLRILKYKQTYDEKQKFYTWIFKIARNLLKDYYSKTSNQISNADISDFINNQEFASNSSTEKNEETEQLYYALNKLPSQKKEILIMCKMNGMRYKEVAEIMDITESAVKVKVHRALGDLRKIYFSSN